MNNKKIGIGIFCFGDDYYFKGVLDKIPFIINYGYSCYILTDQPEFFENYLVRTIPYNRTIKSYHDKILLTKYILKECDICVLIDADIHITDYSFLSDLLNFDYKEGISYPFSLKNHKTNVSFIKELPLETSEWSDYKEYVEKISPNFGDYNTIWENILVINKIGFDDYFYDLYEKLQVIKETIDLKLGKEIYGCGEGLSIMISAKHSKINIEQDKNLFNLFKNKMVDVSRRFTPKEFWPEYMK